MVVAEKRHKFCTGKATVCQPKSSHLLLSPPLDRRTTEKERKGERTPPAHCKLPLGHRVSIPFSVGGFLPLFAKRRSDKSPKPPVLLGWRDGRALNGCSARRWNATRRRPWLCERKLARRMGTKQSDLALSVVVVLFRCRNVWRFGLECAREVEALR